MLRKYSVALHVMFLQIFSCFVSCKTPTESSPIKDLGLSKTEGRFVLFYTDSDDVVRAFCGATATLTQEFCKSDISRVKFDLVYKTLREDVEAHLPGLESEYSEILAEIEEIDKKLQELEKEKPGRVAKMKDLSDKFAELTDLINKISIKLMDLRGDVISLDQEKVQLFSELVQNPDSRDLKEKIVNIETKLASLNSQIINEEKKFNDSQAQRILVNKEFLGLVGLGIKLVQRKAALSTRLAEIEPKLKNLRAEDAITKYILKHLPTGNDNVFALDNDNEIAANSIRKLIELFGPVPRVGVKHLSKFRPAPFRNGVKNFGLRELGSINLDGVHVADPVIIGETGVVVFFVARGSRYNMERHAVFVRYEPNNGPRMLYSLQLHRKKSWDRRCSGRLRLNNGMILLSCNGKKIENSNSYEPATFWINWNGKEAVLENGPGAQGVPHKLGNGNLLFVPHTNLSQARLETKYTWMALRNGQYEVSAEYVTETPFPERHLFRKPIVLNDFSVLVPFRETVSSTTVFKQVAISPAGPKIIKEVDTGISVLLAKRVSLDQTLLVARTDTKKTTYHLLNHSDLTITNSILTSGEYALDIQPYTLNIFLIRYKDKAILYGLDKNKIKVLSSIENLNEKLGRSNRPHGFASFSSLMENESYLMVGGILQTRGKQVEVITDFEGVGYSFQVLDDGTLVGFSAVSHGYIDEIPVYREKMYREPGLIHFYKLKEKTSVRNPKFWQQHFQEEYPAMVIYGYYPLVLKSVPSLKMVSSICTKLGWSIDDPYYKTKNIFMDKTREYFDCGTSDNNIDQCVVKKDRFNTRGNLLFVNCSKSSK